MKLKSNLDDISIQRNIQYFQSLIGVHLKIEFTALFNKCLNKRKDTYFLDTERGVVPQTNASVHNVKFVNSEYLVK